MDWDNITPEEATVLERRRNAGLLFEQGLITFNETIALLGAKRRAKNGNLFCDQMKGIAPIWEEGEEKEVE
jgi:hypothetical protein